MAEKKGIPLTSIDGFPPSAAERLAQLWITTAQELVGAVVREDGPEGLSEYLGISQDELADLVDLAQETLPPEVDFAPDEIRRFGMGAMDEPDDQDLEPPEGAVSFAPLPSNIDMRSRMPPVRNQRNRGTCVAFSCTAVREHLLGAESASGDLSEQFLYWACKERDSYNGSGTWISVGMSALQEQGICVENVWPYNPNPISTNEGQGPPPPQAIPAAIAHRISDSTKISARSVEAIRAQLADEKPVAFAVPVYTYWFTSPVRDTGDIRLPLSTDRVEGGHAMCMVGYEDDTAVPGGGYFLVRNSWGTGWAGDSELEPGYARIPYAYIEQFANSAYSARVQEPEPRPEPGDNGGEKPFNFFAWLWGILKRLFT